MSSDNKLDGLKGLNMNFNVQSGFEPLNQNENFLKMIIENKSDPLLNL
ncbi:MAG: hypothetical protein ACT4OY_05485 [Alphaproteobacteria bacterium]